MVPFYSLVATSLYDPDGSVLTGYDMTWAFSNYTDALQAYWRPLLRSLVYGGVATLICLVLGYVLAYAIAFKSGRWKNLMLVLVIAPFFTSFLVRTLSWKLLLSDDGFVVNTLQFLHILGADQRLLATPVAVVAGLVYNFLPFMVLPLFASIDKIDHRLIEAAGDLYSRPYVGFFKVTWPLSLPGVVSGTLLTFIPAVGDYINAELLGSPKQRMIGNTIQSLFTDANNYPAAGALSVILMVLILVLVLFYVRRAGTEDCCDHPKKTLASLLFPRGPRMTPLQRVGRWIGNHLILAGGLLVLVYTFIPIAVVVLMSFNQPKSKLIYRFDSFTLQNWLHPCADPSMCHAVSRSIQIGLLATVAATILGTLMAFALVRHRFEGRSAANLIIFMPMASPEIVMGSSLLALFVASGFGGQLGFFTILIAHIMFCLSFVVVTVRARLAGLDNNLEQAAMDLYATESETFRRITLPLVFPGILGAALLVVLVVLRRLHHHQPQRGQHDDVPDVRVGRRPARRADAGQRRRHADVRGVDRDRPRRRDQPAAAGEGPGMTGVSSPASSSLVDASTTPYWLDDPQRPAPLPRLEGPTEADLVVVGGGYLGLWTALLAKERDPGRDVRAARGGDLRPCGERAQRRVLRGQPHARLRQRSCALARRAGRAHRARPRQPERHPGAPSTGTASTATSSRRGRSRWPRSRTRSTRSARSTPRCGSTGSTRCGSTATSCASGSTRRPSSPPSTTPTRRSSSPPDSPGDCAPRASRSGYGSTSTPP